jgi:hypothetical protein
MSFYDAIRVGASAAADYEVKRSVRFNSDDGQVLQRTPSVAGNRKKWTFSAWIKRSNLTAEQRIFGGKANASHIYFASNDELTWDLANVDSGSASGNLNTEAKFRDITSWIHLVCALDTDESTANNRMRMYINGTELTDFGTRTNPSSGYATNAINDTSLHTIGRRTSDQGSDGMRFDGYMAEVNFIDGLQLTPASFAETNADTGQWNPKRYTGSYGTNGFYLNFSDNSGTTATTLGKDSSGNGNNFTPYNFSVSAGAGNDSLEDSPTNNFPTINPLAGYVDNFVSASNGNLDFSMASNYLAISTFTIPASGKWYAECVFTDVQSGDVSVINPNMLNDNSNSFDGRWNGIALKQGGEIRVDNSTVQSSLTAIANDAIVGVKIDRDAGTVAFTINGSANGTAVNISSLTDSSVLVVANRRNSSTGSNPIGSQNYGQRPFSHLPAGYKALSSANLPDPTILLPDKHFDTLLYTGNNGSQNITGLEFDPDWVWAKNRQDAGYHHDVYDIVRGNNLRIFTSQTSAETTGYLQFGVTGGFSLTAGGGININAKNHVAWCWNGGGSTVTNNDGSISSQVRANTTAGFSIAGWTGTNGNGTVGHGLGVAPKVVIVRRRQSASDWAVYHGEIGNTKRLVLNSTTAESSASANWWNNTSPTSTTFSVGSDAGSNGSTDNYIAYCFSEVAGYSKFGSYTGNGNADGTFVFTGFRPAWVMIKKSSGSDSWLIMDNKRDIDNVVGNTLAANSSGAENADTGGIPTDFLSNGFKCRGSGGDFNGSGSTFVYLAFAESPFKNSRAR